MYTWLYVSYVFTTRNLVNNLYHGVCNIIFISTSFVIICIKCFLQKITHTHTHETRRECFKQTYSKGIVLDVKHDKYLKTQMSRKFLLQKRIFNPDFTGHANIYPMLICFLNLLPLCHRLLPRWQWNKFSLVFFFLSLPHSCMYVIRY